MTEPECPYRIRGVSGGFCFVRFADGKLVERSQTVPTLQEAIDAAWRSGGPFDEPLLFERVH